MASGKGTTFSSDFLKLILNATTITGLARDDTSPVTNIYVSLHTASPGAGGDQTTNEAAYGSYARQPVVRTSSGWTITSNSASPNSNISFPQASSGSETETYVGIGTLISGAGKLLWFGQLTTSIAVATGVTPVITTSSTITEA